MLVYFVNEPMKQVLTTTISLACVQTSPISFVARAVHSGGAKGAVAPARKTKCFFSNIVSDFAGLFLVAILVRNLTKTEFAPADKKS